LEKELLTNVAYKFQAIFRREKDKEKKSKKHVNKITVDSLRNLCES